jgi:hypothetical protein
MTLTKAGKLRKHHQIIGVFSTKKGTFDHKSTNQPKPPEENVLFSFYLAYFYVFLNLTISNKYF